MSVDLMQSLVHRVRSHMSQAFGKELPLAALHHGPIARLGTSVDQSEGMELFNAMAMPMRQFQLKEMECPPHGVFRIAVAEASPGTRRIHTQFCKSLVASVLQMRAENASVEAMTAMSPVLWVALCTACALDHRDSVRVMLDGFPFLLGAALPTTYGKQAELFGASFDFLRTHPGATMRMMPGFVAVMFSSMGALDELFAAGLNPSAPFGAASPLSPHRSQTMVTGFGKHDEEVLQEMAGPFYDLATSLRFVAPACTPETMLRMMALYVESQERGSGGERRMGKAICIAYVTSRFDVYGRGDSSQFTANNQWLQVYMESPWWGRKVDE